jgi:hypothetical protein
MCAIIQENFLNTDVIDVEGSTAMHYLAYSHAQSNLSEIAKALVEANSVAFSTRNSEGKRPLDIVRWR